MRVRFVAHDANGTCVPLFLLNFLRWLDPSNPEIALDILIRQSGPLDAGSALVGATCHWQPDLRVVAFLAKHRSVGIRKDALSSGLRRLAGRRKRLLSRLPRNSRNLVFVNNLANAELVPDLASHFAVQMICRAPEPAYCVAAHRHGGGPCSPCALGPPTPGDGDDSNDNGRTETDAPTDASALSA